MIDLDTSLSVRAIPSCRTSLAELLKILSNIATKIGKNRLKNKQKWQNKVYPKLWDTKTKLWNVETKPWFAYPKSWDEEFFGAFIQFYTFKEIPVKGELYSTMFNQSFSVDGAVCFLKEDKEGRFDHRIDGVLHYS